MKCEKCKKDMDQVICGGYDGSNIHTEYVCMECRFRYIFIRGKDPYYESFKILKGVN